jgi:hypothetical protein
LPTIKILGPDDQQRISDTVESFRLFYEGHDRDNEDQLRYFVRVAAAPDNLEDDLNLSNVYDLVLKNSTSTSFAVIEDGVNNLKKSGYTGRYFSWDVWVTDGYDTVVAEKIKTKKGKRPRYFYLGPNKSTCDFYGTAKYEGLTNHRGIKITLINNADTNNVYTTEVNPDGSFRVDGLPAGTYKLIASDESGRGFRTISTKTPSINAGDEKELPLLVLKDPAPPRIYNIKGIEDTLLTRAFTISGKFSDYGSQVKTAIAVLDKDTCSTKNNNCKFSNLTIYAWSVDLSGLVDGNHTFKITAVDSAGYKSDTTLTFFVSATNMSITVRDKNAATGTNTAMVGEDGELVFEASILQANPPVTEVTWKSDKLKEPKKSQVSDGKASITLKKSDFKDITVGTRYPMYATSDQGNSSNTVRFGFYGTDPVVFITKPAYDTTISVKDQITLATEVVAGAGAALTWTCIEGTTVTDNCFAADNAAPQASWTTAGTKKIIAKVTFNEKTATDTLVVNVIADPPTIKIDDNEGTISKKVNSSHKFEVTAKDKYGTVKELAWKCTNNASWTTIAVNPAQKQITDSMTITGLPSNEVSNYRCIVRATDNVDQYGYDTLYFNIIKDIPTIRLDIHRKELTIKDVEYLKYSKSNILGGEIVVDYACDSVLNRLKVSSWSSTTVTSYPPRVTMPDGPGKYYCVVRAMDGEESSLYSLDTATYVIYKAPPSVTVAESYTRTIKDTLTLYANAKDSAETYLTGQSIVALEWGCGPSSNNNILGSLVQTNKNTYLATLPSTAQSNYLCIVRVTDDDGLTATDTTRFTVELAPPTVTVARKNAVVRPGFSIVLNATATDKYEGTWGYIAKREWSCGANASDINDHWKVVSSYDTTWTAPGGAVNLRCVARATDDDGNIAADTMYLTYTDKVPAITVKESQIVVVQGDVILLDATINNDAWQGINWFAWQCFYKSNNQATESLVKLDYYGNNQRFYDYRENLSAEGKDVYCVVSAEEAATHEVFRDTAHVKVLTIANDLPVGKITAVDTIYPWSGDEAQEGEALYYYSPEWSGSQSVIGTIGDENNRDYYWQFSNVGSGFYRGSANGGLDTSMAQFNDAFRRPTSEGQFSVCLDFRDSISASPTQAFLKRHQAQTTCRTVYVRRAWKNLATNDTVLERSTVRTPPAMSILKGKPTVAYLTGGTTVVSKYYNGSAWTSISTSSISVTDSIVAMRMASNGTDLYLAVLTSGNTLKVYKSASGTSPWATVGPENSSIEGATSVNLTCHPGNKNPVVTYTKGGYPYFSRLNSGAWTHKRIDSTHTAREVNAVFTTSGTNTLLITFTDNTYQYNTYYAIYDGSYSETQSATFLAKEMGSISLATDGNTLYMGYINRSSIVGAAGPYVKKGTLNQGSITWSTESNLQEGMLPTNLRVAARNNKVYAIIDDNGRGFSHCHAYSFDGTSWKPYGENQLPYFKGPFYSTHGYNLYGFAPEIVVSDGEDASVYISMISWVSSGATSQNNGPIIMKNISDKWTINTKP